MTTITRRVALVLSAGLSAAALFALPAMSADKLVIGYQTTVDPAKVAQADGLYEKATGREIDWRKFDSGADVVAAIASGAIQIGYVGSSPLASAASRELPIQTILIAAEIGEAEALVVRNGSGITEPKNLAGKRIAVPFVSTTHYSLLAALKHWGVDPASLEILNVRPPEIAAAFERGDIDGAYVWDPALGQIKTNGTVLVTSADVAGFGAPTFDAWIATNDVVKNDPEAVTAFLKVTGEAYTLYNKDPAAFTANADNLTKIAGITGSKPEDVPALLKGNAFPDLAAQVSERLLGGGIAKSLSETSAFLKEQGKIDAVLADYSAYVNKELAGLALNQLSSQ